MDKSRYFYAKIYGDRALISSPESKSGGEKMTYQVPTREMLRGIIDANYFKPVLTNHIDEVRIMNKIETYTQGTRLLLTSSKRDWSDLSAYTYLTDVCYYVKFHFEWNESREDLKKDRNFKKHEAITQRSLNRGGRRPIFLGVSECMGYIDPISADQYENDEGFYDDRNLGFGLMFNGFIYPNQPGDKLKSTFAPINMIKGRIEYKRPEESPIINELSTYSFKVPNLTKSVDDELKAYGGED
ncbi:MAG: type I-C CRISPR-associated protein Cas5c [Anaerococcus sp.]|nr:type I-C CRISPR-associated protein Cas5c [Anaerococcus sp.]